jgi:hypothetical protein
VGRLDPKVFPACALVRVDPFPAGEAGPGMRGGEEKRVWQHEAESFKADFEAPGPHVVRITCVTLAGRSCQEELRVEVEP